MRNIGHKAVTINKHTRVFCARRQRFALAVRHCWVLGCLLVVRALRSELPVVAFISGRIRSVVAFVGSIKLRKRCPKSCCAELHVQYMQIIVFPNYGLYIDRQLQSGYEVEPAISDKPQLLDLPVATMNAIYSDCFHTVSLRRNEYCCPMLYHATPTLNA